MAAKLGMKGKLYYKVGGQAAGGSWLELGNTRDVTLPLEKATADATVRANQGWRAKVATLKEAPLEFEMVWDTADAGFAAIRDAFLNDEIIGFQVLDEAAGEGLQADFMISRFERTEPLEDVMKVAVTAEVTYSATAPTWIGG